jgi:hypothetical protein
MRTIQLSNKAGAQEEPPENSSFIHLDTNSGIKNILFPEPAQMRSRRIVTRSRARSTGKYPSWKMQRMLQWESVNERNAFRLLDCDSNVTKFAEQPCEIVYVEDGEIKRHFPDILVETNGSKGLWEVKSESDALARDVLIRSALLATHLPAWGYGYRVAIGNDLAKQPRLRNANLLLGFGRYQVTEREQELIRLAVQREGALIWSDACAGAHGVNGRQILCSLVLQGVLALDLNSAWLPETRFFPKAGN